MSDYESKEEKELQKLSENFMKKVGKEEKKEAKILNNCKSKLQYQFTRRIRQICEQRKIKGEDKIRELLDIYPSDLSEYKNGNQDVTLEDLENLSKKLEISPYYLLGVTDNPKQISVNISNMIFGLTLEARYSLIMLYYGLKNNDEEIDVEIVDNETGEIDVNVLPTGDYFRNFEILSAFIADFPNFCDFFTYIKRYVDVKQDSKKTDNNIEEIKEKIQESIFKSLDKIAEQKRKEKE